MKVYNGYIINTRGNAVLDHMYSTKEIAEAWVEFYKRVYPNGIENSGVEEVNVVDVLPENFVFKTRPVTP